LSVGFAVDNCMILVLKNKVVGEANVFYKYLP